MSWHGPRASTHVRAMHAWRCAARQHAARGACAEPSHLRRAHGGHAFTAGLRHAVVRALALALLSAGCADDGTHGVDDPDLPSRLDQVRAPTASPTAQADSHTVVIEQQKNLPVKLTSLFGAGCDGAIHKPDRDGKLVEVHFTTGYMVSLRSNEPRTQAYKSCDLQLTVQGAKGVRFSVQRVRYAGAAVLPSPSVQMKFQSEVFWKNTIFDIPTNGVKDHLIFGRHNGKWSLDHQVKIENSGWSKCLIGDTDEDIIMINTSLSLDAEAPLDADAYLHSAFTDVVTPPAATKEAVVLVDVATQPCTAATPR